MSPEATRLRSLDAFRGLAIAAMILVNTPGSWEHVYPPLLHAEWNGFTPTDMIFPAFLFIVGAAMAFSLGRHAESATPPNLSLYVRILRRSAVLFVLGLLLNGFPDYDLDTLRVMGVLQRIALCYLLAALAVLHLSRRGLVILSAALLLGYWAAMTLVPVPGHGAGVLTPNGNLAAYLDGQIIPAAHLYLGGPFDPEGLLSTLPAVVTVFAGYLTAAWLRRQPRGGGTTLRLASAGLALVLIGAAWGTVFPINKSLWTSSYVVFTAGWALVLLGVLYQAIEVRGWTLLARPLKVMGVNAILVFVASGLVARAMKHIDVAEGINAQAWLYQTLFATWLPPMDASLAYAIATLAIWWMILAVLHRAGIVLKA